MDSQMSQTPFKKRLLSLKKKKDKRIRSVEKGDAALEVSKNYYAVTLVEKPANLGNEVISSNIKERDCDPAFKYINGNSNKFSNDNGVESLNINLNNVCESINGVKGISYPTPDAFGVEQNTKGLECINTRRKSSLTEQSDACIFVSTKQTVVSVSSATDIGDIDDLNDTVIYYDKPSCSLSFSLTDCKDVNVSTKNTSIKRISVAYAQNNTNIDCEVTENSQESDIDKLTPSPPKKQAVSVNLQIKKNNLPTSEDQSKVLILKTNANEKLSHVIVQPPNYKSFRRKIQRPSKFSRGNKKKSVVRSGANDGKPAVDGVTLNQTRLDTFFRSTKDLNEADQVCEERKNCRLSNDVRDCENDVLGHDDMSKTVRADTARSDGFGRLSRRVSKAQNELPGPLKMPHRDPLSRIRTSTSEAPRIPSPRSKIESASSCSPRRNIESFHFNLPNKNKLNKTVVVSREIPHYKIVAGTHFAVDAFCYGDIPGVKNYFLTHFHSDHYSGLKKSFNNTLFCTQITADLCTSRLGVNLKHIRIINIDETLVVEGVEVTAIDANHCPGAVMLLFTLPNGKTLLHTGDFRATPTMESHPAFWNTDIHTIYLDTTYCNPRYDFPTQDQSLEMALHILRQKKLALEKVGKKFSSVLIVCGTYTIGKEKFFLGVARRVGCAVWACPEKERVLRTVERRGVGSAAPRACQLHVVPMRDLTHEKLSSYLEGLQGPFSEVVAFKPSGWENGKTTPTVKDNVTIHGIPYSEHSSFSEMVRFVNFLKPKQVVPTVDISIGVKAVQKYFPCPLVYKEDSHYQTKLTDFFNSQSRQQISAVS